MCSCIESFAKYAQKYSQTITLLKRFVRFLTASFLLIILPLALFGEMGIAEQFVSVGPRVTCSTPQDADFTELCGGAQARLSLSSNSVMECSIDYRRNQFGGFTIIKSYPVQVSLLAYLLPGGKWSPFVLGGAGWYYSQVEGPDAYSHSNFRYGVHAGAGLEIIIVRGMSFDANYKYIWLQGLSSIDSNAAERVYQDSGSMISTAINFMF